MTDNVTLNPGTGGSVVRTIDRTGVETQVNAIDIGGEAGPESLVTSANPMPTKPAAQEVHLGSVGGNSAVVSASFSRPADVIQYAVNDLVGKLSAPVPGTITPSSTGGTLAAGTYYYKIAAIIGGVEGPVSTEVSATTTGSTGSVALAWSAIPGATGYNVYRGTAAGAENVYYSPGNVTSYTDTNAASTAGSPPAAATQQNVLSLAVARVNGGSGVIRGIRLSTSHTGLTGSESFLVRLFKLMPTPIGADNAVLNINGVGAVEIRSYTVTLSDVFNDGSKGFTATDMIFQTAAGSPNVYAVIQALTTYTPASGETFTLELEAMQD